MASQNYSIYGAKLKTIKIIGIPLGSMRFKIFSPFGFNRIQSFCGSFITAEKVNRFDFSKVIEKTRF
jgi:hypothetical protein